MSYSRTCIVIFSIGYFFFQTTVAFAQQSIWTPPERGKAVSLELIKSSFEHGDGLSFSTMAYVLSSSIPISEKTSIYFDVPISHYGYDRSYFDDVSETDVGNPYIGVKMRNKNADFLEIGVRLPLADEEAWGLITGAISDFERWEAYAPNYMTGLITMNSIKTISPMSSFRFRLGSSLLLNMDKGDYEDGVELIASYSGHYWHTANQLSFGVGLSGRYLLTEDEGLDELSDHEFGVSIGYRSKNLQPQLTIRTPLDEFRNNYVNYDLNASITYFLQ